MTRSAITRILVAAGFAAGVTAASLGTPAAMAASGQHASQVKPATVYAWHIDWYADPAHTVLQGWQLHTCQNTWITHGTLAGYPVTSPAISCN
jgi:hypothetical protein